MPMIRIADMDGNVVFEGEGEIEFDYSPDPSAPGRATIRQAEPRPEGQVGRNVAIQSGLSGLGPMELEVEMAMPQWSLDPAGPAFEWVPPEVSRQTLRIGGEPSAVEYLGDILRLPIETDEERRARHERAAQAARGEGARGLMQEIQPPEDLWSPRTVAQMHEAADEAVLSLGTVQEALQRMIQGYAHANDVADALGMDRPTGPDPAHDELIESTLDAFPRDPHNYGYPGDSPHRWTPPADPDEKIRSCP